MKKIFYVYGWYDIDTEEIFYIGKGSGNRYKNISQRNELFKEYIKNHNTEVKILKDSLTEEEAFYYEKKLYEEYKEKNQCFCNLATPGKGGCHFVWTDEFKEYWSQNNPMKRDEQRERMKNENPMFDKEIAKKNGAAHKNPIKIGDKIFDGLIDAAKYYEKGSTTIGDWIRKGKNPMGEKCEYLNGKKSRKGVEVIIDDKLYSSISEAAKAIDVAPNNLRLALKNNRPCKGHICKYANQQPIQ